MSERNTQGSALWVQYAKQLNKKLDAAFESIKSSGAQVAIPTSSIELRETLGIKGEANAIQNER